jgi:hypothetical protein
VTATELSHVPGGEEPGVERVAIAEGRVLQAAGERSRGGGHGEERLEGPVTVATEAAGSNQGAGRMKARGFLTG